MTRKAPRLDCSERSLGPLLAQLVQFRSDRPEDRRPIADWTEKLLLRMGAKVRRYGKPAAPALLASFGQGGVLFSGHIDTVPATGDWKRKPGQVASGRMYGRGTADMKGGVTAILGAVSEIAGRVPVSIALTTDEETGMDGARALLASPGVRRCHSVVVAEPTGLKIGFAEKAILTSVLRTSGKSGHASMPWTGVSANERMLILLDLLRRTFPNGERDGVTFNVGRIRGGVKSNVIPDACEADLDFRLPDATSPAKFEARLVKLLRGTRAPHELTRHHFVTALAQDPRQPHLQLFEKVARRPRGTVYFATEAAIFVALKKPVVIFGPGAQESAHVTDEFVKLSEVAQCARAFRDYALSAGSL